MKSQLLGFAILMSMVGAIVLPASAQQVVSQQGSLQSGAAQPQSGLGQQPAAQPVMSPSAMPTAMPANRLPSAITIPQSTALVVSFPSAVVVDVGQDQEYPLTVPLAQAIYDPQGNLIVPESTPVSIVLQPNDGGAEIVAKSIVVNGQIVPIQASSQMIPGTTITHMRANDRAVENGAVWGRILGSGFGFMNSGDPDEFDRGAMLGSAVGALMGIRNPENTRVVQIPQGSVYVLSLQEPISIALR